MPILGSSNSAANKDVMAKIWTNGDTINCFSIKHCGKSRNCSLRAISPFPTMLSKPVCCWCVNESKPGVLKVLLTHSHTMTPFDTPGKQAFWKHCGKRRNCSIWAISPFPTVFSTHLHNFLPFSTNIKLSSAKCFRLEESKICCLVMG